MVAMMLRASRAFARASQTSTRLASRSLSSAVPLLKRGDGCEALQVGEIYHNFTLKRKTSVPEYNIDALELEHVRTKANYLHIDAKDTNNVFSVMFRTPPYSSNGIAHILEHTVLCGSHQFPVRDPFFNMIKRSLNTYMNALTAYDHTMYPFSTVNEKDWDNLRAVYLDAVFFPNLHRLDFLQEGHRLEIVEDKGGELELQYKGVVYNEMKGVLSDANNLFATKVQQALMDGTIYGHISGGDPAAIPDLTYKELKDFHAKHYHPSNACFYSYGDLPLTEHLQYLDENIMSRFEYRADSAAVRVDNAVPSVDIIKKTGSESLIIVDGPTSNMAGAEASERDPNTKFCMTKYLPLASTDPFETFVMRIVGYLLTNGPSSELYKALIESGLAQDFSVGTGFDTSTYYPTFGVGVEGIEGEHAVPEIQDAVKRAYESVVKNGFDKQRVDAMLHQMELSLKHVVGNFGMNLMHGVSSVWTHRGDLMENLQLNPLLERLEREMQANPKFLEHYVRDFLLRDDTKQVQVLMRPKESYVSDQEVKEAQRLADLLMEQSNNDLDRIGKTAKELEKYQKKPQPVECLPTLTLADIPVTAEDNFDFVDTERISTSEVPTQFVKVPTTNEISYVRVLFDTTQRLPLEYQLFVPLFTSVFGSLGTSRLRYDALPTVIQNCSGGISCSGLTHPSLSDAATTSHQSILLGTLSLPHKLDETLQIMHELLTDTQFLDPENLKQLRILLQMGAANASNSISSSGASLAGKRSRVGLTDAAFYEELYSGLTQIEQLQKWAQASDEELVEIAKVLQTIARTVFTPDNMRLSVVTEDKLRGQASTALEQHLLNPLQRSVSTTNDVLPSADVATMPSLTPAQRTFFGFPLSVNFVVETLPSVPFAHPDHVPLTVLAQMMSSCFLHQQVREQGGAYGSGVSQGEGTFSLSSHYDPNTLKTLEVYEKALQWAADGKFTDRDIQEALLSIFASIDAPKTPSMKGKMSFLRGITNEMRQERREQYLALSKTQLVDVATHYFAVKPPSHVVIVGKESETKELQREYFEIKQFST
ncbi:hypothetical protein Poli38472_009996 [Pythium oligandrum]|uniref:Peptidase M16C associated domain-containing protein n=1 Tax=Pythium oligandrum TaxID=41045 RepID=A0A8K1C9J8_PYTOL|nr:hypothetical protein Poli38472_009996 [Pythium oligandrum]|eukprot:TMW58437.1 hypothetical protein Poli38472_009996 [Pythium oligandrum]